MAAVHTYARVHCLANSSAQGQIYIRFNTSANSLDQNQAMNTDNQVQLKTKARVLLNYAKSRNNIQTKCQSIEPNLKSVDIYMSANRDQNVQMN